MEKEAQYLLNILKGFIQEQNPESIESKMEPEPDPNDKKIDWNKLIRLSEIHSVTGILGYMIMKYPSDSTAAISGFMRMQCLNCIGIFTRRVELMKQLIAKMNEAEIDHLIFKGYVVRNYYPIPELRTFGDIDFLIHSDDREKSNQLMLKEGFQLKTDWEPVYSYFRDIEFYEIHTDVMEVDVSDKADYKGYYQQIWEHAGQVDQHTWELTPEFHFLYLLTHIAKHISGSGAGIRMYMDIAVFVKHFRDSGDAIDWKYISGELEKLKLADFANVVLTVAEKYFGVESPIPLRQISEEVLEDFMDFTMEGGTFGHAARDAGLISLKRQNRNEENVSRVSTLLHRMFPSAETLEKRYTYLQNRHWLIPVAWVHRLIRTRETWGAHAEEAKSIMSVEEEKVLRLKRVYREIGL